MQESSPAAGASPRHSAVVGLQWHTKVRYSLDLPMAFGTGAFIVTKKRFDSLTPEHQQVLHREMLKVCKPLRESLRQANADAKEVIRKSGVEFIQPTPDVVSDFTAASQRAAVAMAGDVYPAELYQRALELLGEHRSSGAETASESPVQPSEE